MSKASETKCKDCTYKHKISATVWKCMSFSCIKDLMPKYKPKEKPPG